MACLPLVAALLGLSGCSASDDGLPRQAIAGTVLLDGRRFDRGAIVFEPKNRPTKKDSMTMTGDEIVNGRFSLPRRKGLVPGRYRIMILPPNKRPPEEKDRLHKQAGNPGPPADQMIPARFNEQTELEFEFKEGITDLKIEIQSK
jgi:hypothetical protein